VPAGPTTKGSSERIVKLAKADSAVVPRRTPTQVRSRHPVSVTQDEIRCLTTARHPDDWTELDTRAVDTVRVLAADAVQKVGNGHPGTAMSLAPLAYTLFQRIMRHDPSDQDWIGRDRFAPVTTTTSAGSGGPGGAGNGENIPASDVSAAAGECRDQLPQWPDGFIAASLSRR